MFKVNDKVYCPLFGWGIVVDDSASQTYPILVSFSDRQDSFTAEGKFFLRSPQPILFHTEVEYVAVEPKFTPGEWVQVSEYGDFPSAKAVQFSHFDDGFLADTDGVLWKCWKKLDLTKQS
jgi:hypothetical protein